MHLETCSRERACLSSSAFPGFYPSSRHRGMSALTYGFVGRTAAGDDGRGVAVLASHAVEGESLAALDQTALEVLAKHSSDPPGLYQMSLDGGRRAVMTLVRVTLPAPVSNPLEDATPLPSDRAVSPTEAPPPSSPRSPHAVRASSSARSSPTPTAAVPRRKMPRCGSSLSPSPSNASTAERPRPPPESTPFSPNAYAPPLPTSDTPPRNQARPPPRCATSKTRCVRFA